MDIPALTSARESSFSLDESTCWNCGHRKVLSIAGISVPVAFGFSALGSVFAGFFSPPTGAVAQSLARPDMRAMAHATWTMLMTLVGMGLGPLLVGVMSEGLDSDYGTDSIRYALLAISVSLPLSSLLFLRAARSLRADLARLAD